MDKVSLCSPAASPGPTAGKSTAKDCMEKVLGSVWEMVLLGIHLH